MKNRYYPNLASPITINGVTFKNRIFGAPMSNPELDPDCHMREEDIAFHANRGRGGFCLNSISLLHRNLKTCSCRLSFSLSQL